MFVDVAYASTLMTKLITFPLTSLLMEMILQLEVEINEKAQTIYYFDILIGVDESYKC